MKKEMDQMLQFGAYETVQFDSVPIDKQSEILDFVWLTRSKVMKSEASSVSEVSPKL